jgi:DNA primase
MIDYSSVDFVDLLENRLGLRNVAMTAGGVEVKYSCHRGEHAQGDSTPSARINSEKGVFICHGCQMKGSAPDLVADVQQISRQSAERFLREIYGVSFNEPVGGSMVGETEARFNEPMPEPERIPPPESWLASVRLDWYADPLEPFQQYMLDRGLSRETLTAEDCGYDFLSDRITIPIRDLDGSLVGIKGRDWSGRHPARYMALGNVPGRRLSYGFDTYEKTRHVVGLNHNRQHRSAVLLEGEVDRWALLQLGVPRPVASGSVDLSPYQVKLLVAECDEVIVYRDRGSAGDRSVDQAVALLEPYQRVRVVEPLDVDPCDALKLGRGDEVLQAIAGARSSLLARPYSSRILSRA